MKRRILVFATALLVALGGVAVTASPAWAALWGCGEGLACISVDFSGGGADHAIVWSQTAHNTCVNLPPNWRNVGSSSVVDYGNGWDIIWFEDLNCNDFWGGDRQDSPNSGWNYSAIHGNLQDDVESFIIEQ